MVSDTRDLQSDESGKGMVRRIEAAGHLAVSRDVVADDRTRIAAALRERLADAGVDAVLLTGGTGVSARDVTADVVRDFLDLELPGFGELFRVLSHSRVGPAAMLSRAMGGIAAGKPVFCFPGSPAAAALGLEELVLPELGHLIAELRK